MKGSGTIEMLENAKDVVDKMEKSKRGDRNHHPRVESDTQVNIGNFLDVQYTGSVFFGSEPEELTLVFDTGSDMVVVETDLCPSCFQSVFNTSESSSFARVDYTDESDLISMDYLSASLVGYNATDTISIDE